MIQDVQVNTISAIVRTAQWLETMFENVNAIVFSDRP
jgi:hypothetical protein